MIDLLGVEAPRNTVEFDVCARNLAEGVHGEEVEAFRFVLASTDSWEVPVPHDASTVIHHVQGLNPLLRMLGHFSNPLITGGRRWSVAKLWWSC